MPTTTINLTGQALSKTDDTNVTLTLGGTPLTALLKATSLTLGWTGTLAATRGGTGLGALGTANQLLRVNGAGTALEYFTPSFGTGTVTSVSVVSANGFAGTVANATTTPAITISTSISGLLKGNGTAISAAVAGTDYLTPTGSGSGLSGVVTTVNGASGAITNVAVTTNPLSQFAATTSTQLAGVISDETGSGALVFGTSPTITTSLVLDYATASTIVYSNGSKNLVSLANGTGVLTNNGSGTLTWVAASSGITIGGTAITSGTDYRILFQDATASDFVTQAANFTMGAVAAGYLDVPVGYAIGGSKFLQYNSSTGSTYIGALAAAVTTGAGIANLMWANWSAYNNSGSYNTGLGYQTFFDSSSHGSYNTGLGYQTLRSGGSYNTAIGYGSMFSSSLGAISSTLALGVNSMPTASNQCVIGAAAATSGIGVYDNIHFNGVSFTSPASVTLHACHGSGTNVAGANITLDAGNATGTGASGNFKVTSSVKGSSGTTQQTSGDRLAVIGKYVDLTAATATAFCRINIPTSTTSGGFIVATIEANDGVDYQARTFYVSWSAANKAGTTTVGLDVAHEIVAATSGTLTGTMTLVDSGSGNIDFKMDAISSLVETTLRISFQVFKNFGTGAITAA